MSDGYEVTRQKLAALAGQRARTEEDRLRYRVAEMEAKLAAAERERDEAVARAERAEAEAEHYRGAGELLVGAEEERQAAESRVAELEGAARGVLATDMGYEWEGTGTEEERAIVRLRRALADAGKGDANG